MDTLNNINVIIQASFKYFTFFCFFIIFFCVFAFKICLFFNDLLEYNEQDYVLVAFHVEGKQLAWSLSQIFACVWNIGGWRRIALEGNWKRRTMPELD